MMVFDIHAATGYCMVLEPGTDQRIDMELDTPARPDYNMFYLWLPPLMSFATSCGHSRLAIFCGFLIYFLPYF